MSIICLDVKEMPLGKWQDMEVEGDGKREAVRIYLWTHGAGNLSILFIYYEREMKDS